MSHLQSIKSKMKKKKKFLKRLLELLEPPENDRLGNGMENNYKNFQ